ncbi:MAG: carboxypeptidase regulatory-like domain-containing protein, partial [Bacteroidales bacterium]|nr:carboxypeptidase regulatory-like domain-containing protein [Bacteroidales bacterium]
MANTMSRYDLSYKDLNHTTYLYYKIKGESEKHALLYYGTFDRAAAGDYSNYAQVCEEAGQKGWMVVTKPAGDEFAVGRFTIESLLSKKYDYVNFGNGTKNRYTVGANGFTQHALSCNEPVNYADDRTMKGVWEMPSSLADKEIELYVHGAWYNYKQKWNCCGEIDILLGTFDTKSDPAPMLMEPFFYPMDESGNPEVGKMAVVLSCTQEMVSYTIHYGKSTFSGTSTGNAELVTLDANDTLTPLYADVVSYYSMSDPSETNRQTQKQKTGTVFVPPFHKIYDFHAEPYTDESGEDRNYNKLSWTIRHSNIEDFGAGDMFVIERATQPDFSDAVELPATVFLPLSVAQDTTLTYVDNTFNEALPANGKLYYRITRGYAAGWEWSNLAYEKNYCAKDSIDNHAFLWSLYSNPETNIPTIKTEIVNGTSAMVQINLCNRIEGNNLINYVWDKKAQLVLIRHNLTQDVTTEIKLFSRSGAYMTNCRDDKNQQLLWSYKFLDEGLYPCCQYKYSVRIDTTDCIIRPRENAILEYDDPTVYSIEDVPVIMTGFTAAKDESKDFVLLSWQNDPTSVDTFYLDCRTIGKDNWQTIAKITDDNYYEDYNAMPGIHYEYRLSATYSCYGDTKDAICAADSGWLDPYGSISGSVIMPNGTGIGGVRVVITDENGKTYTTTTNSDGSYICDELIYDAAGTNFSISVEDTFGGGTYISATTELPTMNVSLMAHDAEKSNYVFRPSKFYSITGRVLYENTSVPVAYAEFEAQFGKTAPITTMTNASGEPVKTDLNGYFTLQVPTSITSLRVYKKNHEFAAGGYLTVDGKTDLALSDDLREIRFYDKTKAHVLGRVSAGMLESLYTLGTDSSTNRLGDDITLILELEGDNISQLVNDPNDLSRATMDTTIIHTHAKEIKYTNHVFQTVQNTTRKRVTIHVDNVSGEFRAELLPVRYKVVQMYANGYASLLNPDQAMPVLDLTESILTPYEYNYVYHSDPVIAYKQTAYGMMLPYCGEGEVIVMDMENKADIMQLVNLPKKALKRCTSVSEQIDSVSYLFGYPVFTTKTYSMRVGVYEPYYYNNDPSAHDVYTVPLQGDLKVYNGMASTTETATYKLNKYGETSFNFVCNNTTFTQTGENALRTLELSYDCNGKRVQATQLQAYVLGSKDIDGGMMQKLGSEIVLDDVLRDPYGAGSYATLEKGASYSTYYHSQYHWTIGLALTLRSQSRLTMSLIFGSLVSGKLTSFLADSELPMHLEVGLLYDHDDTNRFKYSTTSAISTSAGDRREDIGAEADVYIGHTDEIGYVKKMVIQTADSLYAASFASQFDKGNAHIIAQGRDTAGKLHYLMVNEMIVPKIAQGTQFAYSQHHILNTIIPDLERKRNDLIVHVSSIADTALLVSQLIGRANEMGQVQYISLLPESDKRFGSDEYYVAIFPDNIEGGLVDEVHDYNDMIQSWKDIIKANERIKADIKDNGKVVETYALSGGVSADYSEAAEVQHDHYSKFDFHFSTKNDEPKDQLILSKLNQMRYGYAQQYVSEKKEAVETMYGKWDYEISPLAYKPWEHKTDFSENETASRKVSFHLGVDRFASNNQTVYRVTNASWKGTDMAKWWKNAYAKADADRDDTPINDFVFIQNGGTSACPWVGADSAHFLFDTQLSAPTLKLDNPSIEMDRHEQSDIPADEAAIFTVTIANESEHLTDKVTSFIL